MTLPFESRIDLSPPVAADSLSTEAFSSWQSKLNHNLLRPELITVLRTMIDEGKATTLDNAASILDLQETIIHSREHMWGS